MKVFFFAHSPEASTQAVVNNFGRSGHRRYLLVLFFLSPLQSAEAGLDEASMITTDVRRHGQVDMEHRIVNA